MPGLLASAAARVGEGAGLRTVASCAVTGPARQAMAARLAVVMRILRVCMVFSPDGSCWEMTRQRISRTLPVLRRRVKQQPGRDAVDTGLVHPRHSFHVGNALKPVVRAALHNGDGGLLVHPQHGGELVLIGMIDVNKSQALLEIAMDMVPLLLGRRRAIAAHLVEDALPLRPATR